MIIRHHYPLISCICITANRPEFLLKAMVLFDAQNYPNRELIISIPKADQLSKNLVNKIIDLSALNAVLVERENHLSLGQARNEAVAKCNGEYICTWDDDDWYREVRLMYQYTSLGAMRQKKEACILTSVILYDRIHQQAFYSGKYNNVPYKWAGTLLCKKDLVINHPYTDSTIAEDLQLINYLESSKYLYQMENFNLYAFIYHGGNVTNTYQFHYFMRNTRRLDPETEVWLLERMNKKVELLS